MRAKFCCLVTLLLSFSLSALAQDQEAPEHLEDSTFIAPVILDGETLFRLRGTSAVPASYRARQVLERIIAVASDPAIDPESITIEPADDRVSLMVNGESLVIFFPVDAEVEKVPLKLVAGGARTRISHAIKQYREWRSPQHLLRSTGLLVGATALAALLAWAVVVLFGWLNRIVERRVKRHIEQLEQASHRILDAGQIWGWLGALLRAVRAVALFALTLVWLSTILGLYPWTRPLASQIFRLVLEPIREIGSGIIDSLPDLFFLVILAFVVRFILRAISTFFQRVHRGWIRLQNFDRDLALPTYRIIRVAVIVFAVVIAYPYIPGSDSQAFKGMSIFFGVILSIGSSSFIANIIAGYSLIYRRAFREGDRIRVGELEGEVVDMRTMNTRIRSLKNEEYNIPNSVMLGSAVINYSTYQREPGLILHAEVGIGYDASWRQVEAMLLAAADRVEGLQKEPAPFVLQQSLGDFTVVYQVNAYCRDASRKNLLYSALIGSIQDVFNEYGVQIMSPNYVADPEDAKLVPPGQWYVAPAQAPATEAGKE